MKKATRPREKVYINYITVDTQEDGRFYSFFGIDEYSKFAFLLSTTIELSEGAILLAVMDLMKHKDFVTEPQEPFTIVCNMGQEIEDKLAFIVAQQNGKISFDKKAVHNNTNHFIQQFKQRL